MQRARLSYEDAMTLSAARDVYRVQRFVQGLLLLFFVLEFAMLATHGAWMVGVGVVAVQWACLWCLWWLLRWALLWANRGVYWCIDHATAAVVLWWQGRKQGGMP